MIVGILIPLLLIPTSVKAHMGHSFPTQEWIDKVREHESRKKRTPIDEMINNSLLELEWKEDGSDGTTESEELLQLQSSQG